MLLARQLVQLHALSGGYLSGTATYTRAQESGLLVERPRSFVVEVEYHIWSLLICREVGAAGPSLGGARCSRTYNLAKA